MELVRIDMENCNLSEGLVHDRSEWRNKFHVANCKIVMMMMTFFEVAAFNFS